MNPSLAKALIALIPSGALMYEALVLVGGTRTRAALLQLVGAACLVLVALAHVFEALQLLTWMHWGGSRSLGHFVDLSAAVLGVTLFPIGYVLHARRTRAADDWRRRTAEV